MRAVALASIVVVLGACSLIRNLDDLDRGTASSGAGASSSSSVTATSTTTSTGGSSSLSSSSTGGGGAGGSCAHPPCGLTAIATNQPTPYGLAVDTTYAYWTLQLGAQSARAKKDASGIVEPSVVVTGSAPRGLAIDGTSQYWADYPAQRVAILSLDGSSHLGDFAPAAGPTEVAVDDTSIFFTAIDDGTVRRADKTGPMTSIAIASSGQPVNLALDDIYVYWTNSFSPGAVDRVAKDNTDPTTFSTIVANAVSPTGIAVDASYVYWLESGSGLVQRKATSGGSIETVAGGFATGNLTGITLHDSTVYFTTFDEGSIYAVDKSGGMVTTLATGQANPRTIVVDDDAIYWTNNQDGGSVMRLAK